MQLKNSATRFGIVSISFHWAIALLVIGMLCVGLYMTNLSDKNSIKFTLYDWHKSFGVLILFLAILRLIWREMNRVPVLPYEMPAWQKLAARFSHFLLYLSLFLMPLTGWMMSSAGGYPVKFFEWLTLPALLPKNETYHYFFSQTHEIIAYTLIGLILVHAGAALQHHFLNKDDILRRMLP